ncbi:MAG: NAD-binding protein, partial [Longimicrobiales bacterium]
ARVGLGCDMPAAGYPVPVGELHMAMGRGGYAGLVRLETGALNVAAAVDPDALAGSSPHGLVNAILVGAGLPPLPSHDAERWRGTPPLTRVGGDYGAERMLRLGDAAGYVEPFTGQGMSWAIADGRAAAALALRAVEGWSDALLAEWRLYRGVRRRESERLCRALAWALRRPWMVSAGVRVLGLAPALAAPFVGGAARVPDPLSPVPA